MSFLPVKVLIVLVICSIVEGSRLDKLRSCSSGIGLPVSSMCFARSSIWATLLTSTEFQPGAPYGNLRTGQPHLQPVGRPYLPIHLQAARRGVLAAIVIIHVLGHMEIAIVAGGHLLCDCELSHLASHFPLCGVVGREGFRPPVLSIGAFKTVVFSVRVSTGFTLGRPVLLADPGQFEFGFGGYLVPQSNVGTLVYHISRANRPQILV